MDSSGFQWVPGQTVSDHVSVQLNDSNFQLNVQQRLLGFVKFSL